MENTFKNGNTVNPTFENLTPHDVNIILPDGEILTIPASGKVARVGSHVEQIGNIGAIPVVKTVFDTNVTDLPDPQEGVIYLTSTLVAQQYRTGLTSSSRPTCVAMMRDALLAVALYSASAESGLQY